MNMLFQHMLQSRWRFLLEYLVLYPYCKIVTAKPLTQFKMQLNYINCASNNKNSTPRVQWVNIFFANRVSTFPARCSQTGEFNLLPLSLCVYTRHAHRSSPFSCSAHREMCFSCYQRQKWKRWKCWHRVCTYIAFTYLRMRAKVQASVDTVCVCRGRKSEQR